MHRRIPLPHTFTVEQGRHLGLTPDELRSHHLSAPFRGIRAMTPPADLVAQCSAYAAGMTERQAFSHQTAALLWDMPLPLAGSGPLPLHVAVPPPDRAPRGARIRGHQVAVASTHVATAQDLPVLRAAAVWAQLSETLAVPDLVAVGDFIVTGDPWRSIPPLATITELRAACRAGRGSRVRNQAITLVRDGPLSRPESLVRVLLSLAGLPDPVINGSTSDARGSFIAMTDLAWPEYRFALEYEGDYHRDIAQFRHDLRRVEILIDNGWSVMRISAADLFDGPLETLNRVARRLRERGCPLGDLELPDFGQFRR